MKFSIRLLYLYLFSFIGLLVTVIGAVRLLQLGIKIYVFKGADQYTVIVPPQVAGPDGKTIKQSSAEIEAQRKSQDEETKRQREREVSEAAAMILVGAPLYLYHWKMIQKSRS